MSVFKLIIYNLPLIKTLIGVLVLCSTVNACTPLQDKKPIKSKKEDSKFDNLLTFNDYNEYVFVYYQYCLKKSQPINEKFLENMEYTANLLLDTTVEELGWGPEYAKDQILERRAHIQKKLSDYYNREGCYSSEGLDAAKKYKVISKMTKEMIKTQ